MLVTLGATVYELNRNVFEIEGIKEYIETDLSSNKSIASEFSREELLLCLLSFYTLY